MRGKRGLRFCWISTRKCGRRQALHFAQNARPEPACILSLLL